ncbi:MAG: formylglycine-generating enzyme family protein [Elusimicrobiota bacterium]|nr:MAG: formylglycine-generating enzyme family protein [Elusimicrobiota bacterium]
MVEVAGKFCVDAYEASLVEVRGADRVPWSPYHSPLSTSTYRAVSARGQVPQGYISGVQAQAACRNAGKRLCSKAEWLAACQGQERRSFPYGAAHKPGACNEHSKDPKHVSPLQRLHKGNPTYDLKTMLDPRINQLPDTVLPGGSKPECVSPAGAYDMVGNLHEWIADKTDKGLGIFKGGYYNEADLNGPGCLYQTTRHDFAYADYSIGFRCCADAIGEPAFK